MKYIGRILGWILLGINICMAVLLLICAYSSYINPVAHPVCYNENVGKAGLNFGISNRIA